MRDPTSPTVPLVASVCSECGAEVEFELGATQIRCGHCGAGMAIDRGLRLIRLDCPRCRGNFYYIDGGLCGQCPYCDTPLLALARERLLRYLVRPTLEAPPEGAEGAERVLLPFWHLSGLSYGWDIGSKVVEEADAAQGSDSGYEGDRSLEGVRRTTRRDSGPTKVFRGRVIDFSFPDPATSALGITSLRSRGSVFPLELFSAGAESLGRVVAASLEIPAVRELMHGRSVRLGDAGAGLTRIDCQRHELVAETLSLFYYPFWVRRKDEGVEVWDAVSGERETLSTPGPVPAQGAATVFDELKIIELTCGGCDAPLPSANHAHVIPCRRCGRFWAVHEGGLRPFTAHFAPPSAPPDPSLPLRWLPFYRVEAVVRYDGREARKSGELRSILGITAPPLGRGESLRSSPADSPLVYYVPAYGALKAPRLDFAARDLTRAQPLLESGLGEGGELWGCFFAPDDATRLGYVTLIPLLPGTVVKRLRSLRIATGAAELWYLPFVERGREIECLQIGTRYEATGFRGVRH
jgi:Zn finger protein HypA/HybF involved in hydrogenase expression